VTREIADRSVQRVFPAHEADRDRLVHKEYKDAQATKVSVGHLALVDLQVCLEEMERQEPQAPVVRLDCQVPLDRVVPLVRRVIRVLADLVVKLAVLARLEFQDLSVLWVQKADLARKEKQDNQALEVHKAQAEPVVLADLWVRRAH